MIDPSATANCGSGPVNRLLASNRFVRKEVNVHPASLWVTCVLYVEFSAVVRFLDRLLSKIYIIKYTRARCKVLDVAYNRRETRDKRPMGRDPENNLCHLHTSVKLFWSQPIAL